MTGMAQAMVSNRIPRHITLASGQKSKLAFLSSLTAKVVIGHKASRTLITSYYEDVSTAFY